MAHVTSDKAAPTRGRVAGVVFRTIANVMSSERLRDLSYYVTGGRFRYLGEDVRWWIVVPKSEEQAALNALRESAKQLPWATRKVAHSTSLDEALKALGFDPYRWDEYMDPIQSGVLRYLTGTLNPVRPELGSLVIQYLGRAFVVRSPEIGSTVIGRGSWSQRNLRRMPETDEMVLKALAPFVHPGSVAHSHDGKIRYMYEAGRLVSQLAGPPQRSIQ
jgi:hypothetical protein